MSNNTPRLIYCADGNARFAEIAIRQGYQYGAQLPNTIYFAPAFVDQKWRNPQRARYMETLAKYRPALATVLDWERDDQFAEVMSWAEQAAHYVTEAVIIIPKVVGGIARLPRYIGNKPVRLGYSASSTFSSTPVALADFKGWPVHCLGGSVKTQMHVTRLIGAVSADGNYLQRLACESCLVYSPAVPDDHRGLPRLKVLTGYDGQDAHYLAFELSCLGAQLAWQGQAGPDIYDAQMAWLEGQGLAPKARQLRLYL